MLWLNFIHLYQPANLEREKLDEAIDKSYERVLRALEAHPNLKITANITGGLLERLGTDLGRTDLLDRLKIVIKKGQLEIVGSAAYHALLPLVGSREAIYQIKEQEKLILKYLGVKKLKGFFLPELAYSPAIAKIIKKLGYEWIIVDEITAFGYIGEAPSEIYLDKNSGLKVVVRSRAFSESFVPDSISTLLEANISEPLITATDAELYGLRHHDPQASFEKIIKDPRVKTSTLSKYIASKKIRGSLKLLASNWQTTESELLNDNPFALWQDPKNSIHADLWALANLAQELNQRFIKDQNAWWSRWHLSRGLQSCAWWWASRYDFRAVYGPLAWSPDEVERGVSELIRSVRSLEKSTDKKTKIIAEKLTQKIRTAVWLKHWQ